MKQLLISRPDGSSVTVEIDEYFNNSVPVLPGDDIQVVDEEGELVQAEFRNDGNDLVIILPTGNEIRLEGFFTDIESQLDPITATLQANEESEEPSEASQSSVGGSTPDGGVSLMRMVNTDYLNFGNSIDGLSSGSGSSAPPSMGAGGGGDATAAQEAAGIYSGGNGNDIINAQTGDNTITAGEGNNQVTTGSGNDNIFAGSGNDAITSAGGNNNIDAGGGNNDVVTGGGNDAILTTGNGQNTINAGDGDNSVTTGGGADEVTGGSGNDAFNVGDGDNTVDAGEGDNQVVSGGGNDNIVGGGGDNEIDAGDGANNIAIGDGDNNVTAGTGDDTVNTGDGDNTINTGDGNNAVNSGSGADQITSGSGDDNLNVGDGNNTVDAGDGDNNVTAGEGNDSVNAGDGNNTVDTGEGDNSVTTGNGDNDVSSGSGDDSVSTGDGNNTVNTGEGDNSVTTGDGNNEVTSGTGDDTVNTGDGDNTINTGDGNNAVNSGAGSDQVTSGSGDDELNVGDGNNTVDAGEGDNTVTSGGGNDSVNVGEGNNSIDTGDGNNSVATGDGDNNVTSGTGDDTINTGDGDNTIDTGDGNNAVNSGSGSDQITSGAGDDNLNVGNGDNTVSAGEGNNNVTAGTGNDSVDAGSGNNTVDAGEGDNTINTGDGNNDVTSGTGDDSIATGDGDNTIDTGEGNNNVSTGDGNNDVSSGSGNDTVTTGDGDNTIDTGEGDNAVNSGSGSDQVTSGSGSDDLNVGDGDNTVSAGAGNDNINSGSGNDSLDTGSGDNTVDAGDGNNSVSTGDGNNTLTSGTGNDTINTGDGDNTINTGDGDNAVTAGSGSDEVTSGSGSDDLNVGDGNNTVSAGAGDDNVSAGAGNDSLDAGSGNNTVDAGDGNNSISTGDGNNNVTAGVGDDSVDTGDGDNTVDTGDGDNSVSTGDGNNNVTSGTGDDTINTGDGDNTIDTGEGNNAVNTGAGADNVTSGSGSDNLDVGNGDNTVSAGAGDDNVTSGSGNDSVDAGTGNNTVNAGDGDNTVSTGDGNNDVTSGSGNDTINTGDGDNTIDTGEGNNAVNTGAGADNVTSGSGSDDLDVGNGNNTVSAGAGDDNVTSGSGNDSVDAGTGNNTVDAGDGDNNVSAGDGDNSLTSGGGDDTIDTGDGDNTINTGQGDNTVSTGDGNNDVTSGSGNDTINTGDGDNTIDTGEGNNAVNTGAGADNVTSGSGSDDLDVGNGNNTVSAGAGDDNVTSGSGNDSVDAGTGNNTVDAGDGDNNVSAGDGDNSLTSGGGDDTIDTGDGDNTINTGQGDNAVSTGDGNNDVTSGSGNDTINTGDGDNTINTGDGDNAVNSGAGADQITSGSGSDNLNVGDGENTVSAGAGNDNVTSGSGNDSVDVGSGDNTVNAGAGDNNVLTGDGDNSVTSGGGNDTINTGDGDNTIDTGDGDNAVNTGSGADNVTSGSGSDNLDVGSGNNTVSAGAGDDSVTSGSGNDSVDAGSGNNTVNAGEGDNSIATGDGDNSLTSGTGDDTINTGDGNNTINTGDGDNEVNAGAGADQVTSGSGSDDLNVGDGNNTVSAGAGNDNITSGTGNDSVDAGSGNNTVDAGDGNNNISTGDGDNNLSSGSGNDTINTGGGDNTIDTGDGDNAVNTGTGADNVTSGSGSDNLNVGEGNNTVSAGAGNDSITSGTGNDSVNTGEGNNTVDAGEGNNNIATGGGNNDVSAGSGNDTITTGDGNNTINTGDGDNAVNSGAGADQVTSGSGSDDLNVGDGDNTVTAGAGSDSVTSGGGNDSINAGSGNNTVDAGAGDNNIATGDGNNNVTSGTGDDTINTGNGDNTINTGDGNNSVTSGSGADNVTSGSGSDYLNVGEGNNIVSAGAGDDNVTSGGGNDSIDAGSGNNTVSAGEGDNDISTGNGNNNITSGAGNDTVNTGDGDNTIITGDGNNAVNAGAGSDNVTSGSGSDNLSVGDGNNTVSAGSGNDNITSGTGNDSVDTGEGNNTVDAGEGNNTIATGGGDNDVSAGSGNDTVTTGDGDNTINTGDGDNSVNTGSGADQVTSGSGSDDLNVGDGNNTVAAGAGDDNVTSGSGNDSIDAGSGNNTVDAGAGDNNIATGDGNNNVTSGTGDDTVTTGDGDNVINAGEGNNSVTSGAGADSVTSGSGSDNLNVGDGNNTVSAGAGNDNVTSGSGSDSIDAGSGNNTVNAGEGDNSVISGTGSDSVTSGAGNDDLNVGDGNNTVSAGAGDDNVSSGSGSDSIDAGSGNNTVDAGAGDNTISTGDGDNSITSGGGDDTVTTGDGNNTINTGDGNNSVTSGTGADSVTSGTGNDNLNVGDGNNTVSAGAGDDNVTSGSGSDSINAGSGNNTVNAGTGDNTVSTGDGNNTVTSGSGDDTVTTGDGDNTVNTGDGNNSVTTGTGADSVTSGTGNDDLNVGDGNNTVSAGAGDDNVTSGSGSDSIDAGSGNNTVNAGAGDNTISTGDGNNTVTASGGDDTVTTGDGDNTINTGDGNNSVTSGSGADSVSSGSGDDNLNVGDGNNTVSAGAGNDSITSGSGNDSIETGSGNNTVNAGAGNNTINTGDGNNTITSGGGTDTVTTGSGADTIDTGGGADSVDAGAGNDTIAAGGGNDTIEGGTGQDRVVYTGLSTDYTFTEHSDGSLTITDNRPGSPDGSDRISGVEEYTFTDTTLTYEQITDPVASDDQAAVSEDDSISISVLANDVKLDTDTLTITSVTDPVGTVTNNGDGTISYDTNGQFENLQPGVEVTDTFSYVVTDDHGNSDTSTVTVTIVGQNDGPVATGATSSVTEESVTTTTGTVSATDIDDGSTTTWTALSAAASDNGYGNFHLTTAGAWTYHLTNSHASVQALNTGETLMDQITVTVTDDNGATDTTVIDVTITGTNDTPVATGAAGNVTEETTVAASGSVTSIDTDTTAIATWTALSAASGDSGYGTFDLTSGGAWTYNLANGHSSVQALNAGETLLDQITVTVTDDNGATDTTVIDVTITGTNDAPVAGAGSGAVGEDSTLVSTGQLSFTDIDDTSTGSWSVISDQAGDNGYGSFNVNADGEWSYQLDNAQSSVQNLAEGETVTDQIVVTITDDNGATDVENVIVTITGDNDAPTGFTIAGEATSIGFDGSGDTQVGIANNVDLMPASALTLEMRVSADFDQASSVSVLISYAVESNHNEMLLFANGPDIRLHFNGGFYYTGILKSEVFTGNNEDISLTWDEGTGEIKTYLNGALRSTIAGPTSSLEPGGALVLGQEQDAVGGGFDPLQAFQGQITEVRVFDYARTDQQIQDNSGVLLANPEAESGLVINWQGNVDSSGVMIDRAGNYDLQLSSDVAHSISVDENLTVNAQSGAVVGTLTGVEDVDGADTHTYMVIEDDPSEFHWFEVGTDSDGNPALVVKDGVDLNHEIREFHDVKIRVDDGNGGIFDKVFQVQVTDLNEAPQSFIISREGELGGADVQTESATGLTWGGAPALVALPANFYVQLSTNIGVDGVPKLHMQKFDHDSRIAGDPITLNVAPEDQPKIGAERPETARLTNGDTLVAYITESGDVNIAQINGDGTALTDAGDIDLGASQKSNVDIERLTDGNVVITWLNEDTGRVEGQIFDSSMTAQSSLLDLGAADANSQVTAAGDGFAVLTESSNNVFVEFFGADGASLVAAQQVNDAVGSHDNAHIIRRSNGNVAVVWSSEEAGAKALNYHDFDENGVSLTGSTEIPDIGGDPVVSDLHIYNDGRVDVIFNPEYGDTGEGNFRHFGIFPDGFISGVSTPSHSSGTHSDATYIRLFNNWGVYAWEDHDASVKGVATRRSALQYTQSFANDGDFGTEVLGLADGSYYTFWQSTGIDGSGTALRGQLYDVEGEKVGSAFAVSTDTVGDQGDPSAARLVDGGGVVAFVSDGDIYVQRYAGSGAALGGNVIANSTTAGAQGTPAITGLADGGYVVAWQTDSQSISYQRYADDGTQVGGEVLVNGNIDVDSELHISGTSDGGFVIGWTEGEAPTYIKYDSNGVPGVAVSIVGQDEIEGLIGLVNGGFVTLSDGALGTVIERFDAAGNSLGTSTITPSGDDVEHATMTALQDGGYMVTWEDVDVSQNVRYIYGQRFNEDGTVRAGRFLVNLLPDDPDNPDVDRNYDPSVSQLANGNVVFGWSYENQDSSQNGAKFRFYEQAPAEEVVGPVVVASLSSDDIDEGDNHTYELVSDPTGKFDIVGNTVVLRTGESFTNLAQFTQEYDIVVRITDQGGLTLEDTITIVINGGQDFPTNLFIDDGDNSTDDDTTATVVEGAADGAIVGTLSVEDIDTDDSHTYAIKDTEGSLDIFEIVNGNQIAVKAGYEVNYSHRPSHDITIEVTDSQGLKYTEVIQINVQDTNQAPTDIHASLSSAQDRSDESKILTYAAAGSAHNAYTHVIPTDDGTGDYFVFIRDPQDGWVKAQRYAEDGTTIGDREAVIYSRGGVSFDLLDDGNIVVGMSHWYGTRDTASFTIIDQNLDVVKGATRADLIEGTTSGSGGFAQVTALSGGRFALTMRKPVTEGFESFDHDVTVTIYNNDGTVLTPAFHVAEHRYYQQGRDFAQVVELDNGNIFVAFDTYSRELDTSGWGVSGRILDINGNPLTGEILVNGTTSSHQHDNQAIALGNGNILVSYFDDGIDDIVGTIIDPNGNIVESNIILSDGTTYTRYHHTFELDDGGFFVSYTVGNDVKGQRFDVNGDKVGDEVDILVDAGNQYTIHDLSAQLSNGNLVLVGRDDEAGGTFHKIFDLNGNLVADPVDQLAVAGGDASFVIPLEDGTFVVVRGNGSIIRRQLLDKDGELIEERDVTIGGTNYGVKGASLPDGGYLVVSHDNNSVWVQRFDTNHQVLGGRTRLNAGLTTSNDRYPEVEVFQDGSYVVAFTASDMGVNGYWQVVQQRFDSNGIKIGEVTQVNTTQTNHNLHPDVHGFADGSYMIFWQGHHVSGYEIYGQKFASDGTKVGDEWRINTATGDHQVAPSVTELSDGGYVVVYTSSDGNGHGVFMQRFDSDNNKIGIETKVNTTSDRDQDLQQVIDLNDGGFIVVWHSYHDHADSHKSFGQEYDRFGNEVGEQFQIGPEDGRSTHIRGAQNADGTIVFTYYYAGLESGSKSFRFETWKSAVDETLDSGSVVAQLTSNDPDVGDGATFELLDAGGNVIANDGIFEVVGNELRLLPTASLDYETATSHTLKLRVTDDGGLFYEEDVVIRLTDILEASDDAISVSSGTLISGNLVDDDNGAGVDRDVSSVTGFNVGGTSYTVGQTVTMAGGDLTVLADGSYTFEADPNFTPPDPNFVRMSARENQLSDYTTILPGSSGGGDITVKVGGMMNDQYSRTWNTDLSIQNSDWWHIGAGREMTLDFDQPVTVQFTIDYLAADEAFTLKVDGVDVIVEGKPDVADQRTVTVTGTSFGITHVGPDNGTITIAADVDTASSASNQHFEYTVTDGVNSDTAKAFITIDQAAELTPTNSQIGTPLGTNTAVNPSFEVGPNHAAGAWAPYQEDLIDGWNTTDSTGYIEIQANNHLGSFQAHDGGYYAELNNSEVATLWQAVDTTGMSALSINLQHAQRLVNTEQIRVLIGSTAPPDKSSPSDVEDLLALGFTEVLLTNTDGLFDWTQYSSTVGIPAGQETTYVAFQSAGVSASPGAGNLLDSVSLQGVNPIYFSDYGVQIVEDSGILHSMKVTLTNAQPEDLLAIGGLLPAGLTTMIDQSGGNFELTITGGTSVANYQAVLDGMSFTSASTVNGLRNIQVVVNDGLADSAPLALSIDYGNTLPPIVIDMDGDGVEFKSVDEGVVIDVDDDGQKEQTAWAANDDAVLIYDANNNNDVDGRSEFAFADYSKNESATDMEGLREAFDSNNDGVLSEEDDSFDQFKLWQDENGDGLVGEGEMVSLRDAGIESIGLISDGMSYQAANGDVTVHGESQVSYHDGSTGVAADAEFAFDELIEEEELIVVGNDGNTYNLDEPSSESSAPSHGGNEPSFEVWTEATLPSELENYTGQSEL